MFIIYRDTKKVWHKWKYRYFFKEINKQQKIKKNRITV